MRKTRKARSSVVKYNDESMPVQDDALPLGGFRGDDELPSGGFRGDDELPRGGFRGGERLPTGTFRGVAR